MSEFTFLGPFSPFSSVIPDDLLSLFVGRESELDQIRSAVSKGLQIVAIVGPPGSGKTSVARVFASRHVSQFPGGVFVVGLSGTGSLNDLSERSLPHPVSQDSLLLVDDVEAYGEQQLVELHRYAQAHPRVQLIVTAHDENSIRSLLADHSVELAGLSQVDFRDLFRLRNAFAHGHFDEDTVRRLFEISNGSAVVASVAVEAVKSGAVSSWMELLGYLRDFRSSGLLGPDGRPLGPNSVGRARIIVDVSSANAHLIEMVRKDPKLVWTLPSRRFEEVVAELLKGQGYEVSLTPTSGDGGFDIYAARNDTLGRFLYLVECKRFVPPNKVGVEVIRSLHGVVYAQQATAGAVVTTSYFTKGAEEYRRQIRHQMQLHDYIVLQKWIGEYRGRSEEAT